MTKVFFPKLGLEISVNRVAFKIPVLDLDVYWYGLLIALGAVIAFAYVYKQANKFGVDKDQLSDLVIAGVIAGVLGARIYYVVFSSPGEITGVADFFNLRQGGLAFYGAVIGGVVSTFAYCRIKKIRFLPIIDLISYGFLIGQGIGRWGNFVNQEAFGVNTDLPWGMTSSVVVNYLESNLVELRELGMIVDPLKPVHPTFLYESIWCLIGFLFLHFVTKYRRFDGEMFLYYIGINGLGRFFIEGLRTDSLYFLGMRISQILAILGFIASLIALIYIRIKIKKSDDPDYLKLYVKTQQYVIDKERLEAKRYKRKVGEVETVEASSLKEDFAGDAVVLEEKISDTTDVAESVVEQDRIFEEYFEDEVVAAIEEEKKKIPRAYDMIKITPVKTQPEKQKSKMEDKGTHDALDIEIKKEKKSADSKKLYTKIEIDGTSIYSKAIEKNESKTKRKKYSGQSKSRDTKGNYIKHKKGESGKKIESRDKE